MYTGLVSKQAIIEHLSKRLYETALNNVDKSEVYTDIAENRLTVWVAELPSVQPKEKTGKWEEVYGTNESPLFQRKYYCSCCCEWNAYGKTAYCMNCGAKMEV